MYSVDNIRFSKVTLLNSFPQQTTREMQPWLTSHVRIPQPKNTVIGEQNKKD